MHKWIDHSLYVCKKHSNKFCIYNIIHKQTYLYNSVLHKYSFAIDHFYILQWS